MLNSPAHIPNDLVVDFNLFDDHRFAHDLHDELIRFVEEGRNIFWTPHNGGQWVIVSHEAVFQAARDTETFRNSPLVGNPDSTETIKLPIGLDGEAHAAYRRVLVQAFSPKSVGSMAGQIRELTVELIERAIAADACEFVAQVAEPLPVLIFMKLMGFPVERMAEFRTIVSPAFRKAIRPDAKRSGNRSSTCVAR